MKMNEINCENIWKTSNIMMKSPQQHISFPVKQIDLKTWNLDVKIDYK